MKSKRHHWNASPLLVSGLALSLLLFNGCGRKNKTEPQEPQHSEQTSRNLSLAIFDTETLWIDIAESLVKRQKGLMFIKNLPENQGMLFVFERPQKLSFWMKNTYVPLDIAFISADSTILNIEQMIPLDTKPRYYSKGNGLYAIEANLGWFEKHGIKPGQKVKILKKHNPSLY